MFLEIKDKRSNTIIISGTLYGKILPSSSSWIICDNDPSCFFRGKTLKLTFEKSHSFKDIWANVFVSLKNKPE